MTDEKVVELIKSGDEKALEFLYRKNYRMVVKLIMRNSGTEDEAKDVFQDALIVFWEKVRGNRLVLTSKISTYLFSVAQNLWRKELDRKLRNTGEMKEGVSLPEWERQEKVEVIQKCLKSLSETCRKILTLYYFDQLSMVDLAKEMGFANADTAKTKKYKCKTELDKLVKVNYRPSDFQD
jgi:RNA polymerase sigma factor (sigma-70 family)